jgi:hypothetical protein
MRFSSTKCDRPHFFENGNNYLDITETIYNSLTSLKNVNEFYEGENEELSLTFNIELSSLHDAILENNESDKENIEHEIGHRIINSIS